MNVMSYGGNIQAMLITFFLYIKPPTKIRQRKLTYKLYIWNLFSNFVMLVHPLDGGTKGSGLHPQRVDSSLPYIFL